MAVQILDSSLRDGAQGEGISFSLRDKLNIYSALDRFGIELIEAGNPFSNPKDLEFFRRINEGHYNAKAVAFGSTVRKGLKACEDENLAALLKAQTEYVSIFGKAWKLHVECILGVSPEENLRMIADSIGFLVKNHRKVIFDAEHFFDGYKADAEYALKVLATAEKAGASVICLCDTNGGTFPEDIKKAVKAADKAISVKLGIHCHNDNGCAVANTLTAYKAGAEHIQGTFTGFGERCGNASLSTVIADIQLKYGDRILSDKKLAMLTDTARYISEVANVSLPVTTPYIGSGAFSHKAGMHADGVAKNPATFEHIRPEAVGNERRYLLSEVSGRAAILSAIRRFDDSLNKNSPQTIAITKKLKELEQTGFRFEAATASFDMMVLRELGRFVPHFDIDYFKIISSRIEDGVIEKATALIKVRVGDSHEITADEGNGPVNAIDKALRKALEVFYPQLKKMHLLDYKVRVIGSGGSTAAVIRVLITSTDGDNVWTTVGVSEDIISASVQALNDSIEYMLNMGIA